MTPTSRWLLFCPMIVANVASLAGGTESQAPPAYTISFTQGKEQCQAIHFPERWIEEPRPTAKGDLGEILRRMYSEDAVFRRTPDMGPDSVLVSVQVGEDRKSPHKYLLNLDASPAIQAASDDEWNSARPTRIGWLMWQKVPGQGLTLVP